MISEAKLKGGLTALGEAYGRKVDENTDKLWRWALRDLNDERFTYAVDQVIRSERFWPSPAVVLARGYDMPLESDVQESKFLIRSSEAFWSSPSQAEHVGAVVRDNPISQREANGGIHGSLHYARRIAIEAGLMTEAGNLVKAMPELRLPYREPGEDG